MNLLLGLLVGLIVGAVAMSWWSRRRLLPVATLRSPGEGPPLLEWLLRANGALGAWLVGPGTREAAGPPQGLSAELDHLVRERLEQQRQGDGQGVERLESGTLVFASLDGRAAGLHLPPGSSTGARATAMRDLARLLDYDRWRPVLADVAKTQETAAESVGSFALRLALQLERQLGVESCVAVKFPVGVRIVGVSLRSDRRLLSTVVERGTPLESVALGASGAQAGAVSPMGSAIPDRRQRRDPAYLCAIPGDKGPIGAVAVWTPEGLEPVGPALASFRAALSATGARLTAALEREALSDQATQDPLTGLRNRLCLEAAITSISTPAGALIYADLDHFKALNDRLGHAAGDEALVHVARILLLAVREDDTVARIGGEEFALWLPGAVLERARQVAERVRQALTWSDWRWQGEKWPLTASFGVAACPETTATRMGLPAQADAALYEAKRAGRDLVVVAQQAGTG